MRRGKGILLFIFVMSISCKAHSQQTVGNTDIEVYSLSGNISFQSHAYTTTQLFDRRETLGALTAANMYYSFLGFSSGLDLRYSTDDNEFRQSMNRFSFFGSYKWARLSAGDVSPNYSQYSLRGTMVRGGELGCYNQTPHDLFLAWFEDTPYILTSNGIGYGLWEFSGSFGILNSGRSDLDYEDWYGHQLDRKLLDLLIKYQ